MYMLHQRKIKDDEEDVQTAEILARRNGDAFLRFVVACICAFTILYLDNRMGHAHLAACYISLSYTVQMDVPHLARGWDPT